MLSHDKEPGPTQETARSERMDQGGVGYKPSVSSSLAFMIEACVIEVFMGLPLRLGAGLRGEGGA